MFERHHHVGTLEEALICLRLGHTTLSLETQLETQEVVKGRHQMVHCQKKSISVTILSSTAWSTPGGLVPCLP